MADYEDMPVVVIERHTGAGGAFLWGALLGAGVALLLAPRAGAETQADLREGALRLRRAAEDRVSYARDTVAERVDRTRDRVQQGVLTVRDTIEGRVDQVRHAVDAGRQAAREARHDLEHRVHAAKAAYSEAGHAGAVGGRDTIIIAEAIVETEPRPELG